MTSSTTSPVISPLTRRTFIAGTASVAGVGVLAACGAAVSTDGGATTAPPATGGDGALVAAADVPVGGAVSVKTAAGDEIVVAQPQEGTFVAFSAVCTHMGCIVVPDGAELRCPCHGSVFEAGTGANVSGPAPTPLPTVAVQVEDGQVVAG